MYSFKDNYSSVFQSKMFMNQKSPKIIDTSSLMNEKFIEKSSRTIMFNENCHVNEFDSNNFELIVAQINNKLCNKGYKQKMDEKFQTISNLFRTILYYLLSLISLLLSPSSSMSIHQYKPQQRPISSKTIKQTTTIVKSINHHIQQSILVLMIITFSSIIIEQTNANKIIDNADLTTILIAKSSLPSSSSFINQIDLIQELQQQKRSYDGLIADQQKNLLHFTDNDDNDLNDIENHHQSDHNFQNDNDFQRQIKLNYESTLKAIDIISNSADITFLIQLKQYHHNSGVLFAFTIGNHRIFEIQSSGRRKELRIHYRHNNVLNYESFDVDIVDDKWHKLAITISYKQLDLYVDCIHRYRRTIQPIDRLNFLLNSKTINNDYHQENNDDNNNNITLWIGQRSPRHFLYKGYISELRIISAANGFRIQCPTKNLDTACPTCGQYKELKDSINQLENTVKLLTEKLLIMEQRLTKREQQCECLQKSCFMNGTKYIDGNEWFTNDHCHRCKCLSGSINCYQIENCNNKNHHNSQPKSSKSLSLIHLNDSHSKLFASSSTSADSKNARNSSIITKTAASQALSKCFYNKKFYHEGDIIERWTNKNNPNRSKCYECVCHSRSMHCKEKQCPELNCPPSNRILPDDKCCMICKTDYCSLGHDCHPMAECHNLATNYTCRCKSGYKGNGHTCYDIDECNIDNQNNNNDGYDDRIEFEQNPFFINNNNNNDNKNQQNYHHYYQQHYNIYRHKCNLQSTICVNTPGSYECRCKSGFIKNNNTKYECIDIDECTNGQHNCSENAICLNEPGAFQCQCKQGYEGDGFDCKPVCNDSCLNGGQCVAPNTCSCRKGYYGHRCEEDIDECKLNIHQCPKNSKCINKFGWYQCECNNGYEENSDEFSYINHNDIDFECKDINECLNPLLNTCPSNSKCINTNGSYRCDCNDNDNEDADDNSFKNNSTNNDCPKTCIVNGMERKQNEQWRKSLKNSQCTLCECNKGVVNCRPKQCDCDDENDLYDYECCPECKQIVNNNENRMEKLCHHQENHQIVYRNGERWTYECETCECMNGEIDCWNECPKINCLNAIRLEGDCCLRCEDDPCQQISAANDLQLKSSSSSSWNSYNNSNSLTKLSGCYHQDNYYKSGQQIDLFDDKCANCLCQNGRLCCSYTFPCLIDNDNNNNNNSNNETSTNESLNNEESLIKSNRNLIHLNNENNNENSSVLPSSTKQSSSSSSIRDHDYNKKEEMIKYLRLMNNKFSYNELLKPFLDQYIHDNHQKQQHQQQRSNTMNNVNLLSSKTFKNNDNDFINHFNSIEN